MNIYHIGWTQSESFGLNAVVIAASEDEALKELDLNASYNSEIRVNLMGVCTDGTKAAQIVCQESL
jgi:hypothetical protein